MRLLRLSPSLRVVSSSGSRGKVNGSLFEWPDNYLRSRECNCCCTGGDSDSPCSTNRRDRKSGKRGERVCAHVNPSASTRAISECPVAVIYTYICIHICHSTYASNIITRLLCDHLGALYCANTIRKYSRQDCTACVFCWRVASANACFVFLKCARQEAYENKVEDKNKWVVQLLVLHRFVQQLRYGLVYRFRFQRTRAIVASTQHKMLTAKELSSYLISV